MIHLRIIYDSKGWAYYYRACALKKYSPSDFTVTLSSIYDKNLGIGEQSCDLVFCLPYSSGMKVRSVLSKLLPNAIFVVGFNTGWPRRWKCFRDIVEHADAVIVNNRDYWERAGKLPNTYWISNGVDREVFHPKGALQDRRQLVLWCGKKGVARDLKGYHSIAEPLSSHLRRLDLPMQLNTATLRSRNRMSQLEMAKWFREGTIFVVTSRLEGTPNPALEAAASGCTVVSTRVGNMPELISNGVNGYLVDRNVDAFVDAVILARTRYLQLANCMQTTIRSWDWASRSQEFFGLFRRLVNDRRSLS